MHLLNTFVSSLALATALAAPLAHAEADAVSQPFPVNAGVVGTNVRLGGVTEVAENRLTLAQAAPTTNPLAPANALAPAPTAVNVTPPSEPKFFSFVDNVIGYRVGTQFKEPNVRNANQPNGINLTKNVWNLTHADAYKYGSNFISLDVLKSDRRDPSNKGNNGAVELYFIYRGQLSPDEIFGTKMFPSGPIRDITFEAGFDHSTKNTRFGAYKWLIVAGPNIHFNVPGFLNVGLHYAQEWNHNGIVGRKVDFDPTFEVEAVYQFPLNFIPRVPLRLEGFTNLVTPKGKDGFGNPTTLEVLSQNRLTLDAGQVLFNTPRVLDASVGFQYWWNKFGNDHTRTRGAIEKAPFFATRLHF